jgi:hypothetical protein
MKPRSPHGRVQGGVSLAAILLAGGFYVLAAPQPGDDIRVGASRSSAVMPGIQPSSASVPNIKIVGAAIEPGKPCDEQTWPYIDRRCLTSADAPAPAASEQGPRSIATLLTGVWPARAAPSKTEQTTQVAGQAASAGVDSVASVTSVNGMYRNPANNGLPALAADVPLPPERPDGASLIASGRINRVDMAWSGAGDDPAAPLPYSEQRRLERHFRRLERAELRAAYREIDREIRRCLAAHGGAPFDCVLRGLR